MIIVHAVWKNDTEALWFWAESIKNASRNKDETILSTRVKKSPRAPADDDFSRFHPFSVAGDQLRSTINEIFGNHVAPFLEIEKKKIWLPSFDHKPVCSLKFHEITENRENHDGLDENPDSPEFNQNNSVSPVQKGHRGRKPGAIKEPRKTKSDPAMSKQGVDSTRALQPWTLDVVKLPVIRAIDAWMSFSDSSSSDVMLGTSFRFWNEITTLALNLVVQEAFFPTLMKKKNGQETWHARWNVVLTPAQDKLVDEFASCMPPACRAVHSPADVRDVDPKKMILDFLNAVVDGYIRLAFQDVAIHDALLLNEIKRPRKIGAVIKHWIQALLSSTDFVDGQENFLQEFSRGYQGWVAPVLKPHANATFRTCFKIFPVNGDTRAIAAPDWMMTFHLQALDDPSLLVPAEAVWKERSRVLNYLKYRFENPQEHLLEDLGRATKIYPAIEQCLESARPVDVHLSVQEAMSFLHEIAPLFEQEGFGVVVPNWWKKTTARLGIVIKVRSKPAPVVGTGVFGLDSIVDYDWQLSLGDQVLSRKEFENLVKLKVPVVKIRGEWVELNKGDMEKLHAFLKENKATDNSVGMAPAREMALGDAIQLGLGLKTIDTRFPMPVNRVTGDEVLEGMLDALQHADKITPVPVPSSFNGALRLYQITGVSWMAFLRRYGFGACLADDMGLGKTIEVIALLLHEKEHFPCPITGPGKDKDGLEKNEVPSTRGRASSAGKKSKKKNTRVNDSLPVTRCMTLLICPMSVVGNWVRELAKFAPSLNVMVHYGTSRETNETFWQAARNNDITITTYALASRDKDLLSQGRWTTIILDEAQNIKNFTTKQAQSIKSFSSALKLALTGTPIENRLLELWSIMDFLNPGYLGSHEYFHKMFSIPIERYHDHEQLELLQKLVLPFVLRRVKTDKAVINDLPEKMEKNVYCTLTREQASLYEATVQTMLADVENSTGIQRRGQVLAGIMKLKQICNHPAQFLHDGSRVEGRSGKITRLMELLDNTIASGQKLIIFTQFKEMGFILRDHLETKLKIETPFLYGGTPKSQRDTMIQDFQRPGSNMSVFILSLKAGGTGLNLTAASFVVHFDRWWNPAVENQASDRAYRIGQSKNVQVYKLVCMGTLEERIDEMIEQKKTLANGIITSGEAMITELSTGQLRELLTLKPESVEEE